LWTHRANRRFSALQKWHEMAPVKLSILLNTTGGTQTDGRH
jgi:hypothetical protein